MLLLSHEKMLLTNTFKVVMLGLIDEMLSIVRGSWPDNLFTASSNVVCVGDTWKSSIKVPLNRLWDKSNDSNECC
jgi:hypothetical protein